MENGTIPLMQKARTIWFLLSGLAFNKRCSYDDKQDEKNDD
jgi:hypothetical protein